MNRIRIAFVFFAVTAAVMVISGCNKKVAKAPEPVVEPPKQEVVVEPPAPPPPPPPPPAAPNVDSLINVNLVKVYFDYNASDIRGDASGLLQKAGAFLKEYPNVKFTLEGNCDERGTADYNMGLGEKRAKSVKDWLVNFGISADRIQTVSYGKERLISANCGEDDACHQTNRRVEYKVTSK